MLGQRRSPRKRASKGKNDLGKVKGSEDTRSQMPEKAKKHRKPSATPQPETETRLRPNIKGTPNSQHLTNTPEHRRSLFGKTQADIFSAKTPSPSGSPSRHKFRSDEGVSREPSLPGPTVPKASLTPDTSSMFRPPNNLPSQVVFHPTYGWGWVMQQPVPPPSQEGIGIHDKIANLELPLSKELPASSFIHLPTTHSPRSPSSNELEGSALGSPFQPQVQIQYNEGDTLRAVRSLTPQAMKVDFVPQSRTFEPQPLESSEIGGVLPHLHKPSGLSTDLPDSSSFVRSMRETKGPLPAAQDEQTKATSTSTSVNREQIRRSLVSPYEQVVDFFDLYRHYFDLNSEEELKRLPANAQPKDNSDISDDVIKAAFDHFRKETTEYETFLSDWKHIRQIGSRCRDPDSRHNQFRLFTEKLERMVRWGSVFLGFETVMCTVGREIHTDQALSETVCSDMVVDFLQARLQISESDLAGHLKAHAYDRISRRTLPTILRASSDRNTLLLECSSSSRAATPRPNHTPEVTPATLDQDAPGVSLSDVGPAPAEDVSGPLEDPSVPLEIPSAVSAVARTPPEPIKAETSPDAQVAPARNAKGRKKTTDRDPRLEELKKGLRKMTEQCGVSMLLNGKTQFTSLPKILALNGWVLENWPEDLIYPCDCKTGKGVAGLAVQYQESLLEALKNPDFPLRVVKKSDHAIPATEPVIIGVPPPPDSAFTHGRRRYLDKNDTEDRGGPPRLKSTVIRPLPSSVTPVSGSEEVIINTDRINHRKRPSQNRESDNTDGGPAKKVRFEEDPARREDCVEHSGMPHKISGGGDVSTDSEDEEDHEESEAESISFEQESGGSLEAKKKPELEAAPQAVPANDGHDFGQADEEKVFPERFAKALPQSQQRRGGMPQNRLLPDIVVDEGTEDSNDMARYANARPGSYWLPMQQPGQYAFNLPPGTQLMSMNACGPSSPDPGSGMPCVPVPSHFLPYTVPQSSLALQHNAKHLQAQPQMPFALPGQQQYHTQSHHITHSATQPTPRRTY